MPGTDEIKENEMFEFYPRRKLNALYRAIPLDDKVFIKLRKYFSAMSQLYGIIPLRKAFEIISEQNPRMVTKNEFLAFCEIARHEEDMYYIVGDDDLYIDGRLKNKMDREIVDYFLFDDDDDLASYEKMKSQQKGKPYYIPNKTELLSYANEHHFENSSYAEAIVNYLSDKIDSRRLINLIIFMTIDYTGLNKCDFDGLFKALEKLGVELKNDDEVSRLVNLFTDLNNNSRKQINRGHTPMEMKDLMADKHRSQPMLIDFGPGIQRALSDGSISPKDMVDGVLSLDNISDESRVYMIRQIANFVGTSGESGASKKVGRNDPCPCGSGKKYKKCCGR